MLLRLCLMKFKEWSWRLAPLTKLPELLDKWPPFYDLETFEPMIEYLCPWDRELLTLRFISLKLKEEKMGWQQDFICGGRRKVLLFIPPLGSLVGGLGAQVIHFKCVIHWMFHCSVRDKYIYRWEPGLKEKKHGCFHSWYTTDFPSPAPMHGKVV